MRRLCRRVMPADGVWRSKLEVGFALVTELEALGFSFDEARKMSKKWLSGYEFETTGDTVETRMIRWKLKHVRKPPRLGFRSDDPRLRLGSNPPYIAVEEIEQPGAGVLEGVRLDGDPG